MSVVVGLDTPAEGQERGETDTVPPPRCGVAGHRVNIAQVVGRRRSVGSSALVIAARALTCRRAAVGLPWAAAGDTVVLCPQPAPGVGIKDERRGDELRAKEAAR